MVKVKVKVKVKVMTELKVIAGIEVAGSLTQGYVRDSV
jgi:hypothetical protein